MRTVFTPSFFASASIAFRWSMCECTLPSENRPRKCSVEPFAFTLSISDFQVSPSYILPLSIDWETSFAPCAKTCPAPSALCPTSELPISSSLGRPTAVPCAFSFTIGYFAISMSSVGVFAAATAFASLAGARPTPSMTMVSTGPSTPRNAAFFRILSIILSPYFIHFYST